MGACGKSSNLKSGSLFWHPELRAVHFDGKWKLSDMLWLNLNFSNCLFRLQGHRCNSWRAETKMFLLKLRRPTTVSRKPEPGKAAACALSLSPPLYNARMQGTEWILHLKADGRCACEIRPYLISATHTCAGVICCEGRTPVFMFLSATRKNWESEANKVSPQGSMKYHSFPQGYVYLNLQCLRRSESFRSFGYVVENGKVKLC